MRRSKSDRDDDHAQFGGQAAKRLGGGAGDGLGQIEQAGVFFAAEILGAEEFLEADDLRASGGGFADAPFGFGEVFVGVEGAGHLDQADAELGGVHVYILAELAHFCARISMFRGERKMRQTKPIV